MEVKRIGLEAAAVKFDADGAMKFAGYASVFGGVDSYGDTIDPKAYDRTIKPKNRERPIRLRWNHYGPIIGKWDELRVDEKGLWVEGQLTPGHSVAANVYASMKHGAVDGLSIGYMPKKVEMLDGGKRRLLKEVHLFEISVVEEPADLGAQISGVKSLSENRIKAAIMWLKRAIKLHEGHMDGSVETSEESQMTMMDQMKKALEFLSAPDDSGGGMGGMSKSIFSACSLKEIEARLRDGAGLSWNDATALVSRIKFLALRDGDAKSALDPNKVAALIQAIRIP